MTVPAIFRAAIAAASILVGYSASAALPGQMADSDATVRLLAAQDAAVATVGERLSIAAAPLCRPVGQASGMVVQTRAQYGLAFRASAARLLGIGDYPTVTFVVPDGAAARAGLRAGDQLIALDGRALTRLTNRAEQPTIAFTEAAARTLDEALSDGSARVEIERRGERLTYDLRARPACRARFEVRAGSDTDASASRDLVQVSSDLVDPARSSQSLAPLIAHELAHVVLRHDERLKSFRGGLLPGFGKHGQALRDSELAADRLSVYILAMAGLNPADAIAFWSTFGPAGGLGIFSDRTHPGRAARVAAVTTEVRRIERLRATAAPVMPPTDLIVIPSR